MVAQLFDSPNVRLPEEDKQLPMMQENDQAILHSDEETAAVSEEEGEEEEEEEEEQVEEGYGGDFVLTAMQDTLKIQRERRGYNHREVTRMMHGLALEYKVRSRFEDSISTLREALQLVCSREEEQTRDDGDITNTEANLEVIEKSRLLTCIGNIHRGRGMFKEAIDSYLESVNTLILGGYEGDCRQVNMLVRIIKRAERVSSHPKETLATKRKHQPRVRFTETVSTSTFH